jgi:hypothetical protein
MRREGACTPVRYLKVLVYNECRILNCTYNPSEVWLQDDECFSMERTRMHACALRQRATKAKEHCKYISTNDLFSLEYKHKQLVCIIFERAHNSTSTSDHTISTRPNTRRLNLQNHG